jgi:hypothetical protein
LYFFDKDPLFGNNEDPDETFIRADSPNEENRIVKISLDKYIKLHLNTDEERELIDFRTQEGDDLESMNIVLLLKVFDKNQEKQEKGYFQILTISDYTETGGFKTVIQYRIKD